MILPPFVIDVDVHESGSRTFRMWLPLVLLWPLLFIIVGLALIVAVVVDLVLWLIRARYHRYTLFLIRAMGVLADTRGTTVHVDSPTDRVHVRIY